MHYTVREARPSDVPQIEQRHREQNERDGTNYPLTPIFDECGRYMPNVELALVIVDGDTVCQAAIFEKQVEMMLAGCDPKATAQLRREIDGAFYLLRKKGYTSTHTLIPKALLGEKGNPGPIEKALVSVGFESIDDRLAHFYKDLTKIEEEES